MELSALLYCKEGYGIHAVSVDVAGSVGATGSGSVLRTEHAFEDARRWLDAWIDSRVAVGTLLRRSGPTRNHR